MRTMTDVVFRLPGKPSNIPGKQWAQIELAFRGDDGHERAVVVSALTADDQNAPLKLLHREAREDALASLMAAVSALSDDDLSSLAQTAASNLESLEKKKREQLDAEFQKSLADRLSESGDVKE